jgi:CheY-like chemotaxis protein
LAFKKSVELTLFVDPLIPPLLIGDPGRLRQIIINLANNAIKFSSGLTRIGKVSVRALLANTAPDHTAVSFEITDNGIGINAATREKLFSAFIQADSSTTRRFGGTGLGLAITSQLVELMHGSITVESEINQGSKFSVLISFGLPTQTELVFHESAATGKPSNRTLPKLNSLECLILSDLDRFADDLSNYLRFNKVLVEREKTIATAKAWIAQGTEKLRVIVIDMVDLDEAEHEKSDSTVYGQNELNQLREIAKHYPQFPVHFLLIGRGRRRRPRPENHDLVIVDANILTAKAFIKAIAIAANLIPIDERAASLSELAGSSEFNQIPAAPKQLSREEARMKGSLILVAEDNEINQKVILQQLMLLGQTADIANNGEEALQRWRSGDYGIVFADLHMPKMDGYGLTLAIRAEETGSAHIPIIAFTANALKGESERCLAIGMDDFLSKPVQLQNLKIMLEKWRPVIVSVPIIQELTSETLGESAAYKVVDIEILKALIGNDEELVREFLQDFRASAAAIGAELCTKAQAGMGLEAAALAHKLKSSSRSMGAMELGDICEGLEKSGKAEPALIQTALIASLKKELAKVEIFLRDF